MNDDVGRGNAGVPVFKVTVKDGDDDKDNFLWEPVKLNFKFHRNCVNTGKIGKFLCVRFHFVKFEIYFFQLP